MGSSLLRFALVFAAASIAFLVFRAFIGLGARRVQEKGRVTMTGTA